MKAYFVAATSAAFACVAATAANAQLFDNTADPYFGKTPEQSYRQPRMSLGAPPAPVTNKSSSAFGDNSRPAQWCGWWMRQQLGGGPEMNVAWNWSKWGSPSEPRVGAVVVWPHHVGIITGRTSDGQWIVKSGNDGGQVKERARSISGTAVRS